MALHRWFASSDPEVAEQHLKPSDAHPQDTLERAQAIWKLMRDGPEGGADMRAKQLSMTHAGYLKLYQLSRPDLSRKG
eukprot:10798-Heterococcus_DN1.PRE.1